MDRWAYGAPRQAMLRAALFRLLSDDPGAETLASYGRLLDLTRTPGH
jgi:hypothetical protein